MRNSDDKNLRPVPAIIGPTGVGKTGIAIEICRRLGGEIVSCDSRQIYRGLNIGTAKPTAEDRRAIPHHLIDLIEIGEYFSAHKYRILAEQAIDDIFARNLLPVVVGGTGLYYRALIRGLFATSEKNPQLRSELEREADEKGDKYLWQRLREADPKSAEKIKSGDRVRIIRALEILATSGRSKSDLALRGDYPPIRFRFVTVGLSLSRVELYRRIDKRVDRMMAAGWLEEAKSLVEDKKLTSGNIRNFMGYNYLYEYINGRMSLDECTSKIKQAHRNLAKRQMTWFRREPEVIWLDANAPEIAEKVAELFSHQ